MKTSFQDKDEQRNQALVAVDLSRINSLVQQAALDELPSNLPLRLCKLGEEAIHPTLSRTSAQQFPLQLTYTSGEHLPAPILRLNRAPHPTLSVGLRPLPQDIYRVSLGRRDGKSLEVDMPVGLPRFINAATLKAMVAAAPSDVLLQKTGKHWEICPDDYAIDVQDRTQVFRIGQLEIFS